MTAAEHIDSQIKNALPWQAALMLPFRELIKSEFPELQEDWKWSTGVWTYRGTPVCAFSTFKSHVKSNFFKGASLPDPQHLFNSGLNSKQHRSINLTSANEFPAEGLKQLLSEALEQAKSQN